MGRVSVGTTEEDYAARADSGAIGPLIPVGSGPRFRWELVQFFDVTGMVDHLPECWTTWTGTVDQITGSGQ